MKVHDLIRLLAKENQEADVMLSVDDIVSKRTIVKLDTISRTPDGLGGFITLNGLPHSTGRNEAAEDNELANETPQDVRHFHNVPGNIRICNYGTINIDL